MCENCGGTKTIWVSVGSIVQCQPCLKCREVNKNSLESIKRLLNIEKK